VQPETRFMRLRQAARWGDEIDSRRVCWVGGCVFFLVIVTPTTAGSDHGRGNPDRSPMRNRKVKP